MTSNTVIVGPRGGEKARANGRVLRLANNLVKLPARTLRMFARLLNREFQLERDAERAVKQWIPAALCKQLEAVPGMSSRHECRLLAYLANIAPAGGAIVEIGAWKGKSAAWLVEGSQRRREPLGVVSIDPHARGSWDDFQHTVRQFDLAARGLEVRRASSHEVGVDWRRPVSLLWIDGCHEHDAVVQDIRDFAPHVVPNGWIVFDDAAGGKFPGVERAVAELLDADPQFRRVAVLRHLAVYQRRS